MQTVAANLQPGEKPPVAHTYRNAYGTHFDVAPTWMLLLGVYVVFVVGGVLLLSVIPVRFASNEKMEAPFVLWFGSAKKKKKKVKRVEKNPEEQLAEKESVWQQVSSWLMRTPNRIFADAPSPDADMRYRFHADMTQQLAASAATAKTYESIAIPTSEPSSSPQIIVTDATDELEMKPPPPQQAPSQVVRPAAVEYRAAKPTSRPSSRSSIFVSVPPPSPPSAGRIQQRSARLGSDASSVKAESIGRRSRGNSGASVVETKEDFVRAASHRQSMAVRAERRVTLAREDVSYENLEDDEMQVYEYLEFVRELLDGLALKKLCQKSGRVASRKLYITADMQVVFWNSIAAIKRQTRKSSLKTELIESVQKGVHGSANVMARSTPEREALCVSIRCSDGKQLVLEAKTEAVRQRLFLGFTRLAQEKHEQEATTATALQPTIPEEIEEEFDEELPTIAEGRSPVTRANETELVQQDEYEEKLPPPALEEMLLHRELLSIRSSYGSQADESDDQHGGNDPGDERKRGEEAALSHEDAKSSQLHDDRREAERREEEKVEEGVGIVSPAIDDDDIDNLIDDPELSRE
ncbi:hypothetical protein GN958_ATG03147 [Phytophthora infestans]|uniref:Transmembrane protein n=1 Tax=Phytophthora infestans TaxID=4787 RepID=A0A8S9V8S8_PHYIN|nr:hypothetical protein GN958_ATG03147 [Phytophthora infestans]